MSAIEPAGEKIVRNLQQAIERLHDDISRVELWAGALSCFTKPIPDYGYGQSKFDLPAAKTKSADAEPSAEIDSEPSAESDSAGWNRPRGSARKN